MNNKRDKYYQEQPYHTRYLSVDRYENPKEDFKLIANELEEKIDTSKTIKLADIGCGNGELLYYLYTLYPHWSLYGYDHTLEFIETAKNYLGLRSVNFQQCELEDVQGSYDIIVSTCFLSLFPEIEEPLSKFLELCKPGGHILVTGLFNKFDIDVRVQLRDNTATGEAGDWRTDFNRHSQKMILNYLSDKVSDVYFIYCSYDIDLQPDLEYPTRVWTFRDADGNSILINGAWQIANQTLMVVHK